MFVGDGEALLKETFHLARLTAPSIIFLDEIDCLAPKRCAAKCSSRTIVYCTVLHCTALLYAVLYCTARHGTALHWTGLEWTGL